MMLPVLPVKQNGVWRQAGGVLDVDLHACQPNAHSGGGCKRSCCWRVSAGCSCR